LFETNLASAGRQINKEQTVNGTGALYDQKNSKFCISHQKEFMGGHVGVKGVY
jgi:hypothetical protein